MASSILSSPESRRLGQTLASMQREIATLRAAQQQTQLGNSTLYGAIYIADPDGNVTGIVGEQADGSTGVVVTAGPPPPTPTGLSLTPLMAGVDLGWAGTFAQAKPLNFSHVNAYLSDAGPDFIHGPSNMVGTLSDAGTIPVAPLPSGTQWWARLVAVNTSVPPGESPASVTVGPVTPSQVVAQDVLDGIVTEVKLANDAVTAAKIAAGAVGTGEIAGQAVTLSQLSSGSVDATKLVAGAVTQPAIATNAVTANAIAANQIIAGKIAADAVTANTIAAGSVNTLKLAAEAVSADKIAANAVTAEKINALAITADKIAVNAINASHITAGAVTANKLAATLVLASTVIAGTAGGARVQLGGFGIEAYRANQMKVLDFDTASGDMTIAGRYRSADTGSRVEINPNGTAPDQIRLYQGSVFATIDAALAPGNTAAINMLSQTVNSRRAAVGCYPAEAYIAFQNSGGTSLTAVSAVDGTLNMWSNGNIRLDVRNSGGIAEFTHADGASARMEYRSTSAAQPQLFSPFFNLAVTFANTATTGLYIGNDAGNAVGITASNFATSSSRTVKKRERRAELSLRPSARQGLFDVESKMWNYDHEWVDGEPEPAVRKIRRERPRRDEQGRLVLDPETNLPVVDVEEVDGERPAKTKAHLFPVAEDLLAVLPELVTETGEVPGGLLVDLRSFAGFLWLVDTEQETELRALRSDVEDLKRSRINRT